MLSASVAVACNGRITGQKSKRQTFAFLYSLAWRGACFHWLGRRAGVVPAASKVPWSSMCELGKELAIELVLYTAQMSL